MNSTDVYSSPPPEDTFSHIKPDRPGHHQQTGPTEETVSRTNYVATADQDMQKSLQRDYPKTNEIFHNTNDNQHTFSAGHSVVNFATRIRSLFLWDDLVASSLAFFGSLGLLILTNYISLFRLLCATATIVIGVNWAYVNAMMQGQKIFAGTDGVNPHTRFIYAQPLIPRARVDNAVSFTADLINAIMHEATKIALIDDNIRSVRYFVGFYLAWTLATYIPADWLIGMGLVGAFTGPKLYLQNKHLIDERLKRWEHTARVNVNNAATSTKQQAQSLYGQVRSFADKHGLPAAASKVGATFKAEVPVVKKEE